MEHSNQNMEDKSVNKKYASHAWVFPAIAWFSSIFINLLRIRMPPILNLILGLFQLALCVLGGYIAITILRNKQNLYSRNEKNEAWAGIILLIVTLVLIIIAMIFE